jgi:D-aspartate ligase
MPTSQNRRSYQEPEGWRADNRQALIRSPSSIADALIAETAARHTVHAAGPRPPERSAGAGDVAREPESGDAHLPGVLLTSSSYLGTLAAVRSFGRAGVTSVVADDARLGPASWSRFVGRRVKCPPDSQSNRLLEWLLAFGKEHPGYVLCATSDDSAWLYSVHRTELGRSFRMYQAGVDAVYSLLNKRRLYNIGRADDIDFPRTWFPQSDEDVRTVAREAQFPVVINPVTQILHKTHSKGVIVDDPARLPEEFVLMSRDMYRPELLAFDPSAARPLVQEFQPRATEGIYSLSGFIDESGALLGVRGAMKILQRPRRLGVGLCFERAEVKRQLVDAIVRICRRVGYYGVFEVEFIHRDGKDLLIDFNPRFYGQMAFDIARGLPVPLLAYYAALGDWSTVKQLAEAAQRQADDATVTAHCNRIDFEIMLRAQRLSGGLSANDVKVWRNWYNDHRGRIVHPILDKDDWKPFATEITRQFLEHARHPRAFITSTMMKAMVLGFDLRVTYV